MVNGLFKKLTPATIDALHQVDPAKTSAMGDIHIEEITTALQAVKGELEMAHASLQKLYEETSYVYTRLTHMEQSMIKSKETAQSTGSDEGSSTQSGGSDQGGVVIEKQMFIGSEGKFSEKLLKIQEAKGLTQGLLNSIEKLALKAQNLSELSQSTHLGM